MAFRLRQLEEVAHWCSTSSELSEARESARKTFFGEDDLRPIRYLPGTGTQTSRERRFLGWFMFSHTLDDGRLPAEMAVENLFSGRTLEEGLRAVRGSRYVLAIVRSVIPGSGLFLELEDARFDLRSRELSRFAARGTAFALYVVPSRPGLWIPGPGWLEWPAVIGPNMRNSLKEIQPDPISVERLLQRRRTEREEGVPELPRDKTLEQAVARMTAAAEAEGRSGLILSREEWEHLVLKYLGSAHNTAFAQEVIGKTGEVSDPEELNRWLGLAMNIWNSTPQPDRGGKTAYGLSEQRKAEGNTP